MPLRIESWCWSFINRTPDNAKTATSGRFTTARAKIWTIINVHDQTLIRRIQVHPAWRQTKPYTTALRMSAIAQPGIRAISVAWKSVRRSLHLEISHPKHHWFLQEASCIMYIFYDNVLLFFVFHIISVMSYNLHLSSHPVPWHRHRGAHSLSAYTGGPSSLLCSHTDSITLRNIALHCITPYHIRL